MKYGKVHNGEVVKFSNNPDIEYQGETPSLSELKANGWLPVERESASRKPWQKQGRVDQVVESNKIRLVENVEDKDLDAFKREKIEQLKDNATQAITGDGKYCGGYKRFKQINAAIGLYGQKYLVQMKKDIQDVIEEVDHKENEILQKTGHEAVNNVYIQIIRFVPKEDLDENNEIIVEDTI